VTGRRALIHFLQQDSNLAFEEEQVVYDCFPDDFKIPLIFFSCNDRKEKPSRLDCHGPKNEIK
jgi:hypothetical protein